MFYSVGSTAMRLVMRVITRLEVTGLERVPPEGPLIVVSNHVHFSDPPLLGATLPRKIIFMAKEEAFKTPILGWIVSAYEAFPVRRGEPDRKAIRKAISVLQSGKALGIFPEGTRSKSGVLGPAHPGAALIALRTGAPVLPVAITGTDRFLNWPGVVQRRSVRVTIGKPFRLVAEAGSLSREQLISHTNELMRRIAALLSPDKRGTYGELLDQVPDEQALVPDKQST